MFRLINDYNIVEENVGSVLTKFISDDNETKYSLFIKFNINEDKVEFGFNSTVTTISCHIWNVDDLKALLKLLHVSAKQYTCSNTTVESFYNNVVIPHVTKIHNTRNVLNEIVNILKRNGKEEEDIVWVGFVYKDNIVGNFGYSTWDNFKEVAKNITYESGWGKGCANNLVIMGNNFYIDNNDYDGAFGFDFHNFITKPDKKIVFTKEMLSIF